MLEPDSIANLNSPFENESEQIKQTEIKSFPFKQSVSSLEIYQSTLYVGTMESKVLIFNINEQDSEQEPFSLTYLTKIYPHCTSSYFIVAVQNYLVIVPEQQQQLVRLWDRKSLKLMHGYKGHQKQISQVIFLKNEQYIASASHDATARIWNINQHDEFDKEMIKYQGSYPLLALKEIDQYTLALGGDSCFITLWNWKREEVKCKVFGHPGSVQNIEYYHPYIVSSGGDSKIKIWAMKQATSSHSLGTALHIPSMHDQIEERGPMLDMILQKQIKSNLSQHQFFFKLKNYQMLIVDSTGKVFYINSKLQVKQQKIQIQYFRRIKDIKIWKEYVVFFPSYEKNEKKYVNLFKVKDKDYKEEEATGFDLENALQLLTNLLDMRPTEEQIASNPAKKTQLQSNLIATQQNREEDEVQEVKTGSNPLQLFANLLGTRLDKQQQKEEIKPEGNPLQLLTNLLEVRGSEDHNQEESLNLNK